MTRPSRLVIFAACVPLAASACGSGTVAASLADAGPVNHAPPSKGCQFLTPDPTRQIAFCDTFDAPAGTGNRSGDLNGNLWGLSRTGDANPGQGVWHGWTAPVIAMCGSTTTVLPESAARICNGQLNEAVDDDGGVTSLAMYPKQPFDIAGRTGTVVFDVSNDSQGSHAAWPEFWYTNVAVPEPFTHEFGPDGPIPRDGIGIRFARACDPGQGFNCGCQDGNNATRVFSVDSVDVIHDYLGQDTFSGCTDCPVVTALDCVKEASGPGGALNHIELRMSQNEVDVYATDPGSSVLKEIDTITNINLTLTRGVVWIEDVHYNADKFNTQRMHVFTWDNVGFDGPVLPRDLAFDAPDNNEMIDAGGEPNNEGIDGPTFNLGWGLGQGNPVTVNVPGVTSIDKATSGLLTFTEYLYWGQVTNAYQLNGGPRHTIPWPFPDANWPFRTFAVPIDLSELHPGTNTVTFLADDPSFASVAADIANVDIILTGAGQ